MRIDKDSQRLLCHIPDKSAANCYVKKIMLTLGMILSRNV